MTRSLALALAWMVMGCNSSGFLSNLGADAATSTDGAPSAKRDAGDARRPGAEGGVGHPTDGSAVDAAVSSGNTAAALAAGGTRSTSPHYQFIGTLGQTPTGNGVSTSGKLNGGVVAATQQVP